VKRPRRHSGGAPSRRRPPGGAGRAAAEPAAGAARLDDVPQAEADLHMISSWLAAAGALATSRGSAASSGGRDGDGDAECRRCKRELVVAGDEHEIVVGDRACCCQVDGVVAAESVFLGQLVRELFGVASADREAMSKLDAGGLLERLAAMSPRSADDSLAEPRFSAKGSARLDRMRRRQETVIEIAAPNLKAAW
jgi:hypothetical protein